MRNRYDIRFFDVENPSELGVYINDKFREHETLKGIITTPINAEYANSFKNDLTDTMRRLVIRYEQIPAFLEKWLEFLSENEEKEFTDGQN